MTLGSANDHPRPWRRTDRDDDRDDGDRDMGRGRDERRASDHDYHHERTCSPRRRDRGGSSRSCGGRRGPTDPIYDSSKYDSSKLLSPMSIPTLHRNVLQAKAGEFRLLHALHNSPFSPQEPQMSSPVDQVRRLSIIASKALAGTAPSLERARPASPRNEAWFKVAWEPIPVERVFARIKSSLPPPTTTTTCQQVEEALLRLELAATATDCLVGDVPPLLTAPPSPQATSPALLPHANQDRLLQSLRGVMGGRGSTTAMSDTLPLLRAGTSPPIGALGNSDDNHSALLPSPQVTDPVSPDSMGILDGLFASPPQAILAPPPRASCESPPRAIIASPPSPRWILAQDR
uniref:Uncharacterized protein n=1 Tax=Oryza punctata TaxID=4537 RepID=A0A0E0JZW1_ORYPU